MQPTTKVISSGVVVAAGYDPIVIYKINSPVVNGGGGNTQAYIPNLPTIVNSNSSSIISRRPAGNQLKSDNSVNMSIIIVVSAVGVLCAIVLCYALRVLYVSLNAEEYRLEELK